MRATILLALLGVLVFQLAVKRAGVEAMDGPDVHRPPYRLLSGDILPRPLLENLTALAAGGCAIVYFANPACPGCSALATAHTSTQSEPALWVFEGSRDDVDEFVEEHAVPTQDVIVLREVPRLDRQVLAEIGVYATPTTAVMLPDGALWRVRVTTMPRSIEPAAHLCT